MGMVALRLPVGLVADPLGLDALRAAVAAMDEVVAGVPVVALVIRVVMAQLARVLVATSTALIRTVRTPKVSVSIGSVRDPGYSLPARSAAFLGQFNATKKQETSEESVVPLSFLRGIGQRVGARASRRSCYATVVGFQEVVSCASASVTFLPILGPGLEVGVSLKVVPIRGSV